VNTSLVVFDWAGTLVDFGSRAPLAAFLDAFAEAGLPITEAVARAPMGAHKRDHVREILADPEVAGRVRRDLRREPDEDLVEELFLAFSRHLPAHVPAHAAPIPGVIETLEWLRRHGVSIGSTTGYTRAMMAALEPVARAAGVAPDLVICAAEVPQPRPAPWACLRIAEQFGVHPSRAVKVGDTPADMAEGRNAGMRCVGVSATGNEVGLDAAVLGALDDRDRGARIARAERHLFDAGADAVIESVADLPRWLETAG
jgi:phosphonoacetaldehyde hydrolase